MHWLALHNLWFLFIIPPIIILYLLKRKYEHVDVSSILLWQRVLREQEANRPWQKLRRNLLLLLQLLVACLLILALLKPAIPVEGVLADHTVILLDTSATMLTKEGDSTRFELAKEEVRQVLEHLGRQQLVTLIDMGQEPKVLLSKTKDKAALHTVLEQVQVRQGESNYRAALSLAGAIAQAEANTGIMLFGDGAGLDAQVMTALGQLEPHLFQHVQVGKSRENMSLATFITQQRGTEIEGLVRIDNHGLKRQQGKLIISDLEEHVLDRHSFTVEPGTSYTYSLSSLPQAQAYQAVLTGAEDGLAEDNQLWSVPFIQDKIRAVLVSPNGNRFLSQALSLGNRLHLEKMSSIPSKFDETVDIWIFDGVIPEELPVGNILIVGPQRSSSWLTYLGNTPVTKRAQAVRAHALVEHIDWGSIYVAETKKLETPRGMETLVQAGEEALVIAGELDNRQAVLLSFDLLHSDFPLRTAFPIFIQNAVSWLAPIQSVPLGSGHPGEALLLPLIPGAEKRTVTRPDGISEEFTAEGTTYLYQLPEQTGLYQLREERGQESLIRYFSVQMKESVSSIKPSNLSLMLDRTEEAEGVDGGNAEGDVQEAQGFKEVTFWLVLLALVLTSTEWVVYQRGY